MTENSHCYFFTLLSVCNLYLKNAAFKSLTTYRLWTSFRWLLTWFTEILKKSDFISWLSTH